MTTLQDVKNKAHPDQQQTTSPPQHSLGISITPISSNSNLKLSTSSKALSATSAGISPSRGTMALPDNKTLSGRPLSHHRRKSSVSTRRESQEIMTGVAIAEDEEVTDSRDEIRKRALLALEGSQNVMTGFARVGVPDWKTPVAEKQGFDWDPSSLANLSLPATSLTGKRDSFGRNLAHTSIPNKVELQTLVEEDEEDDDATGKFSTAAQAKMTVPVTQVTNPTPHKNRPASLTLRHLSLVGDLPTPSATPSPRNSSAAGMRPLTLSSSLFATPSPSSACQSSVSSAASLTPSSPSSPSPLAVAGWRQSRFPYRRNSQQSNSPPESSLERQHTGNNQLRTPQSSISSSHLSRLSQQSSMGGDRPVSPTELFAQHAFSMQAHATLLDRIATLEEALEKAQVQAAQKPAEEELIALVADLKASRDTLHAKASAAEAKVAELDHAAELLQKRLESARQEARRAKDRADLLQLEVEGLEEEVGALKREKGSWETERKGWKKELIALEERVEELRAERDNACIALDAANASQQSRRVGGMGNISASSTATTLFEAGDESFESCPLSAVSSTSGPPFKFKDQGEPRLGAVVEEEEDEANNSINQSTGPLQASFAANFANDVAYSDDIDDDNDDEGDHGSYEDEPAGFDAFIQHAMEGDDDSDRSSELEQSGPTPTSSLMAAPAPAQQRSRAASHSRRASLVANWRFPAGAAATTALTHKQASAHTDPFLVTDEDVMDDYDDAPRVAFIGGTPKRPSKKSQTRVEVTPQLADSFAMNFAAEEDEGFSWGEELAKPQTKEDVKIGHLPRLSDPLCPPIHVMGKTLYKLPSIIPLIPRDDSVLTSASSPTSTTTTSTTASSTPAVAPTTSIKPKSRILSQDRPEVAPPAFIPPPTFNICTPSASTSSVSPVPPSPAALKPPSSSPASLLLAVSQSSDVSTSFFSSFASASTSTNASTTTTGDESFSFSYSASPVKPPSGLSRAEEKNVVAFPTTSSSPFAIRSPVSAISSTLASFIPWSPRRPTTPTSPKSPSPTPFPSLPMTVEDLQPQSQKQPMGSVRGTKTRAGTVSADVMRERLRARLVQEGKIKSLMSPTAISARSSPLPKGGVPPPGR